MTSINNNIRQSKHFKDIENYHNVVEQSGKIPNKVVGSKHSSVKDAIL